MYGKDYQYASSRLDGTFVRLMSGEPIVINAVDIQTGEVTYTKFTDYPNYSGKTHLDDVDTCPMPLGYCNVNNNAVYLSRKPTRKYSQGLRSANLSMVNVNKEPIRYNNWFDFKSVANTVENKFPSFTDCVSLLSGVNKVKNPFIANAKVVKSVAWHRYWAVDNGMKVYYRNNCVGYIENNFVTLHSKYFYLKEALSESLWLQ